MTVPPVSDSSPQRTDSAFVADLFHAISQTLTVLECGLEVSLRRDTTAAQFRTRVESALVAAKLLHQRLLEARARQAAGEPGDTCLPVEVGRLLLHLREDLLPIAKSAKVKLNVKCETAMVHGNAARIRNGCFHLIGSLLHTCPPKHTVSIRAQRVGFTAFEVRFSNCASTGTETLASRHAPHPADLSLRFARRTFQAAGGDLVLTQNQSGQFAGYVRLLLAN